jgi:hypothetical protein
MWSLCGWRWRRDFAEDLCVRGIRNTAVHGGCVCSGESEISDVAANKETLCSLLCVCVHALCRRRCLFCQAARFTTALVHVRRRCLLAVFGSARYEESRESVEISRSINGSSLWASIAGNVQVMLVVGSSAVKARARCLLSSRNVLRDFAPALHVSYGRAESRLCMGIPGGCCPDHTEGPQRCCCTFS